jgi:hypothetical protein
LIETLEVPGDALPAITLFDRVDAASASLYLSWYSW